MAFLLAQVGAHAGAKFAERLAELKLTPAHAGILRTLAANPGMSQHALGRTLGILPSRLVVVLDEIEERGLVERRDNPDDRRVYELHLTEKGKHSLEAVGRVARAHQEALCAALDDHERETLAALLSRIAEDQGLTPGVHPGFRQMGKAGSARTPRK